MRTRTPLKRGEMEAVNVILCLGGFPNEVTDVLMRDVTVI